MSAPQLEPVQSQKGTLQSTQSINLLWVSFQVYIVIYTIKHETDFVKPLSKINAFTRQFYWTGI